MIKALTLQNMSGFRRSNTLSKTVPPIGGGPTPSTAVEVPAPSPIAAPAPTFKRGFQEDEIRGIVGGDQKTIIKATSLIEQNVINVKDGALQQVYDLTARYRSNVWMDAIRGALEGKRDAKLNLVG